MCTRFCSLLGREDEEGEEIEGYNSGGTTAVVAPRLLFIRDSDCDTAHDRSPFFWERTGCMSRGTLRPCYRRSREALFRTLKAPSSWGQSPAYRVPHPHHPLPQMPKRTGPSKSQGFRLPRSAIPHDTIKRERKIREATDEN